MIENSVAHEIPAGLAGGAGDGASPVVDVLFTLVEGESVRTEAAPSLDAKEVA